MIFHNTKLINLWETAVSFFLFVLLVVSFSSPRDADNLSLRFENVCVSRRGLLFYCTSIFNLHLTLFFVRSFTHIFDAVFRTRPCKNLFVNGVKKKSIDFGRQSDVDWHPKAKPFLPKLYEFAWAGASTPPHALRSGRQTARIQKFGMGHTRRGSRNKIPRASCLTLNSLRGTHRCHLFHVITDMRSATSLERAPKPWLSTVTICHSGQSPSSGIILMGHR